MKQKLTNSRIKINLRIKLAKTRLSHTWVVLHSNPRNAIQDITPFLSFAKYIDEREKALLNLKYSRTG